MRFEYPIFLALLLLLIPIFFKKKKKTIFFPLLPFVTKTPKTKRVVLAGFLPFLRYFILFLIVIAIARPQKVDEQTRKHSEGIDIMLVQDISESMLSEDFQPENRLEVSKSVLRNFIKGRENDRIGLIIFSGESYTQCPMTGDYDVLLKRLDEINVNEGSVKQGTAIGMAIANAVARLKDSTAKSRVIILVTDGENNTGVIDPITASELANDLGIKIYAVAIGKDGQVPYPVYGTNIFGQKVKQYAYINNKLNTEMFSVITKNTNGSFYRATEPQALSNIMKKIDQLERTKLQINKYTRVNDYFAQILSLVLFLVLTELILREILLRRLPA
jgi:Ca-activated chloride channel homolog